MTLHTALALIELEYLRDLMRPNAAVVADLSHISTLQEDGVGGAFEKSLRVKNMIDELELEAQRRPGWDTLAPLLRSEYRLWEMNRQTPLRQNPFLTHWVEAVRRLEGEGVVSSGVGGGREGEVQAKDVAAARLEMIKCLLLPGMDAGDLTPRQVYEARYPGTRFDVQPYIRMLEEEGIYEPSPISTNEPNTTAPTPGSNAPPPNPNTNTSSSSSSSPPSFQAWKSSILSDLHTNPAAATTALSRLPLILPALDFLTSLLTANPPPGPISDPAPLLLSFTQHALRLIEHIGQPPNPSHPAPLQTDIGIPIDDSHGRDAQTRALRLLILFLSNLFKRGLVDVRPEGKWTLYWDLEGLYRSYMWLGEVRALRALVEGGHEGVDGGEG